FSDPNITRLSVDERNSLHRGKVLRDTCWTPLSRLAAAAPWNLHCSSGKVSNSNACPWVFKATVYKSPRSQGFVGYGDADPSNVSSQVHGAEMRVTETCAVNRALRKTYGIGLCSVEEL